MKKILVLLFIFLISCSNKNIKEEKNVEENIPSFTTENKEEAPIVGEKEGNIAPIIKLETNKGYSFDLNDYKGKIVFINFWATWCGPCVSEMPDIQKLYDKYNENVEFILISSEHKNVIDTFIKEKEYTFPIGYDSDYSNSEKYNTYAIPYTFIIDKEGKVFKSFLGANSFETYEEFLIKALN